MLEMLNLTKVLDHDVKYAIAFVK